MKDFQEVVQKIQQRLAELQEELNREGFSVSATFDTPSLSFPKLKKVGEIFPSCLVIEIFAGLRFGKSIFIDLNEVHNKEPE